MLVFEVYSHYTHCVKYALCVKVVILYAWFDLIAVLYFSHISNFHFGFCVEID